MAEDLLEVSKFEAVGEIIDEFSGKRWAVPADNCEDHGDRIAANPMAMPASRMDKRFHYQWIRLNQWTEYNTLGAVRVTMKEFAGDDGQTPMNDEYGKPLTSYVEYEGAILIKMPKFTAEARWREQDEDARLATQDIYKPQRKEHNDGARGTVEEGTTATVTTGEVSPTPRRSGQRKG